MDSFALGSENISHGAEAASKQISNQLTNPALGVETPADIASARNFFAARVDMPPVVGQPGMPGLEQTGMAALKAISEPISPLLQIIMRMPGHIGLFNSFFEALKGFFLPNTDLLSHFSAANFISGIDVTHPTTALTHLGQPFPLNHHSLDLSIAHDHVFHNLPSQFADMAGNAHLHVGALASLKQSMNVSAGIDLKHPQFEGISQSATAPSAGLHNGESLAGPSISDQSIVPRLSPAQRIFTTRLFESGSAVRVNSMSLANQNIGTGIAGNALSSNNMLPATPAVSSPPVNQINANNGIVSVEPTVQGMHAKALSLNSALHPGADIHHKLAHNPFSKLAAKSNPHLDLVQHKPSISSSSADKTAIHDHPTTTAHKAASSHYTVKAGDTLWKISEDVSGAGRNWTQLFKLNNQIIGSDPNLILPGQKLDLPASHSTGSHELLAQNAIHHTATPHPVSHPTHQSTEHLAQKPSPASASVKAIHENNNIVASNRPATTISTASTTPPAAATTTTNGLPVEKNPEQLLSGAGGAQAATNLHKVSLPNKIKSVVSFSLTPDLSFLSGKK